MQLGYIVQKCVNGILRYDSQHLFSQHCLLGALGGEGARRSFLPGPSPICIILYVNSTCDISAARECEHEFMQKVGRDLIFAV